MRFREKVVSMRTYKKTAMQHCYRRNGDCRIDSDLSHTVVSKPVLSRREDGRLTLGSCDVEKN